ncbi:MAG: glycosyltransferase [Candidatus Pacearchaeota archaeon]
MKISIVMPAYNEENRIGRTLEEYCRFFDNIKKNKEIDYEILIVINGTTDNTEGIVKDYQKKYKEIKYLNFKQGGKGFAIVQGFKESLKGNSELIGFVDADMATSPEDFYDLVKNIGKGDGIIASRWKKGSKTERDFGKIIRSKGFNFLVRSLFLLPYEDTQCGAKIFRKKVVEKIISKIESLEWAFDVDLLYLAKKNHFKIIEYPTIWHDKKGSKIVPMLVPIKMASSVIRLRMIYSPFKFIVRLYNQLPKKIQMHNW